MTKKQTHNFKDMTKYEEDIVRGVDQLTDAHSKVVDVAKKTKDKRLIKSLSEAATQIETGRKQILNGFIAMVKDEENKTAVNQPVEKSDELSMDNINTVGEKEESNKDNNIITETNVKPKETIKDTSDLKEELGSVQDNEKISKVDEEHLSTSNKVLVDENHVNENFEEEKPKEDEEDEFVELTRAQRNIVILFFFTLGFIVSIIKMYMVNDGWPHVMWFPPSWPLLEEYHEQTWFRKLLRYIIDKLIWVKLLGLYDEDFSDRVWWP